MNRLTCNIEIGDYTYKGVVELEVNSSNEQLTDTCRIVFPRKVEFEKKDITTLIKRGQRVNVYTGYDNKNELIFIGFIKSVKANIPIEILCEDYMFLLKQKAITKTYNNAKISTVLNALLEGIDISYNAVDFTFADLRINKATPAVVLEQFQKDFGLYSFFKENTLYCGLKYWADTRTQHTFTFQKDIITNSLEYNFSDEIKYKVVAVSIDSNNNKTEITVGDEDGDQRTFYYYNESYENLRKRAEEELENLKYDGYQGSFETFGTNIVKHGDAVKLIDLKYPEREGIYLVKSVKYNFGLNGYRQNIELERLLN